VYCHLRTLGEHSTLLALNAADSTAKARVKLPPSELRVLLSGPEVAANSAAGGDIELELPARSFLLADLDGAGMPTDVPGLPPES